MLIEFSVENFRSFRDLATLSMVAAKLKAKNKTLDENNLFHAPGGSPSLLTSAAIYGANARARATWSRPSTSCVALSSIPPEK